MPTNRSKIPIHSAKRSSRLLQLPGELRNKIFEYALTIDDGICYREDDLGIGRLCLHPQEPEGDMREQSHTLTTAASVQESDDEAPTRKRRKIAESDWTIGKPMVGTEKTMRRGMVTVDGHIVANQLQFVDKQLRNQTRALAIRYNDVHILETWEHVIKFVYSVTGHMRLWIQRIVLRVAHAPFDSLHGLKLDEEMHPRFMVHMYLPHARMEKDRFFLSAFRVQQSGRLNTSFVGRLTQNVFIQEVFADVPCLFQELPSYAKVFPWDEKFDEAVIRRFCREDGIEKRWFVPFLPGGIEDLVAVAKEWFEEGY